MCRAVGTIFAALLEALAYRQFVASLSLFCRYYFRRCLFKTWELTPLLYSRDRSSRSDRLHYFLVLVSGILFGIVTLWNLCLQIIFLRLNLNCFKSRGNILSLSCFLALRSLLYADLLFLLLFSCNSKRFSRYLAKYGVHPS